MEEFILGSEAKGKIPSFSSSKKASEKFQETLLAKQYFENVFKKLYKSFSGKNSIGRYAKKYSKEYYELEIFFTNNIFPLLDHGLTLEDLEGIWEGMNQSDKKLVFALAYFSDYTNLEEFEVLYFVAKKIFSEKFVRLVSYDRRMIYYIRKKIQNLKKVFVSSILNKQEYYWLLKLRSITKERLTKDFLSVAQIFLYGYLYLKKLENLIVEELKNLNDKSETEGISPDDVFNFVIETYSKLNFSISDIKNSIRSFKRYFESNILPESLQDEDEEDEEDEELLSKKDYSFSS